MQESHFCLSAVTRSMEIPGLGLAAGHGSRYLVRRADNGRPRMRRGGRVVECTALEMRHTRKGIGGSNPSLSASYLLVHSGHIGYGLYRRQGDNLVQHGLSMV
jgi:hypothetical protein